ncbi:hypothetical protein GCM10010339_94290 [Streptomyces alanosinicus]|uniref:Uncharacterized protein n=1 Tax=Streptomyces alanosinicus TaxID=68171 RepID=A0A918INM9_9ACTN|nr:hypothetical protein GCM10010339_94290 [Streptomyces alanosinicus]
MDISPLGFPGPRFPGGPLSVSAARDSSMTIMDMARHGIDEQRIDEALQRKLAHVSDSLLHTPQP